MQFLERKDKGMIIIIMVYDRMYRYSVYYDEVKAQLLETDKDRLEGTSPSQPSSGMHLELMRVTTKTLNLSLCRCSQRCCCEVLTTIRLLCHHGIKRIVEEGHIVGCSTSLRTTT